MENKHTPGPWEFNGSNPAVIWGGINKTAKPVVQVGRYPNSEEELANALLISAAPDLLEACLQAAAALPTTHGAFETVRKALAKAYGK